MLAIDRAKLGRGALAAIAAAMTFGLAACGDSNDDDASGGGDDVKGQIGAVLTQMQKAFVQVDAEGFCAELTRAGRQEVADYPLQPGDSCEEVVTRIARATRESGVRQRPSVVRTVQVRGTNATAMISNGGRPAEPVEFAKEDGEWRLVSAGLGFQAKTPENANQPMPEKLRRKLLYGDRPSGN